MYKRHQIKDSCLTAQYNWADYGLRYDPANVKFELRPYGENLGCFTKVIFFVWFWTISNFLFELKFQANKVLADNAGVAIGIIVAFFAVQIISMQWSEINSFKNLFYNYFKCDLFITNQSTICPLQQSYLHRRKQKFWKLKTERLK